MEKRRIKKVLVLNCGSSSLKYRLIEMDTEKELCGGEAQRIGPKTAEAARIIHREDGREGKITAEMNSHAAAFKKVMEILASGRNGSPDLIGHRVVHGGSLFTQDIRIDAGVIAGLKQTMDIAPLHNPPAVALIEECHRLYPDIPQFAVFDTVFHSTIPQYARSYAIPAWLSKKYGFRKYGFHGTSHKYVAEEAARMLGKPLERLNAVSCHLGSGGASLCAIVKGRSIDNTMGYSPLPGLVMSTRSGDIDPAAALHILYLSGGNAAELEKVLNKKSGVLGMSGMSGDIRDIIIDGKKGVESSARAGHTMEVYIWRLRKALGSYLAAAASPRALIFTDTIGETVPEVRQAACAGMEYFGIEIDREKNMNADRLPCVISSGKSRVKVLVIATNEELAIARSVYGMAVEKKPALRGRKK